MIQRFLFNIVKAGIEEISKDLNILDDIFSQFDMPQKELDAIRTLWEAKPPHVKHQYARVDDETPLYSIVLGNEQETDFYIGNDAATVTEPTDPDFGADIKSSIWNHTYHTLCYSEHPDHTSYLYEVLKAIYIAAKLDDCGVFDARFSGMDLAPDPRYIPEHLFVRQFTLAGKREFERLDRASKLGKAFKVRGIHLDSSGSPSDVGGVKTLVTVGIPDGDE
jgi:hypothetical protein